VGDIYATISTKRTPQSEPARTDQVKNNAGGYTFQVSGDERIRRFLVLGSDGGTYYTSAAELTKENAAIVLAYAANEPRKLVDLIVEISTAGRAPKQTPGIFALAAASALAPTAEDRSYVLSKLPQVCRTGTTLFQFATYAQQFRGWGKGLQRAVGRWYTAKDPDRLGLQLVKYRQRNGWTHRDLLRKTHVTPSGPTQNALFRWATQGDRSELLPPIVSDFLDAQNTTTADEAVSIIERGNGVTWELLPTNLLNEAKVWEALLEQGVPMTALIRQLPRLTTLGVARSKNRQIIAQLSDEDVIRRARIHPVNVLIAQRTYASGQSVRGQSSWSPDRHIIDTLDGAFYKAFGNVEPANKRTLIALDVSGSMASAAAGLPISCRDAAAAISLVTLATEPDVDVVGFTSQNSWSGFRRQNTIPVNEGITELAISPRQRLDDVVRTISLLPFGGTDCSLPMQWALQGGREYDTFLVMTDNETWAGRLHPHQALQEYRRKTGINARLVVAAFASNGFSIADPNDPGMLDVVGLDSAVPNLIADFSRGL
jgi:60 kDa SS-A/Ro ribonucleoprotein